MDRAQHVPEVPDGIDGHPNAPLQYECCTDRAGTPETVANGLVRLRLKDPGKRRRDTDGDYGGISARRLGGKPDRFGWRGSEFEDGLRGHGKLPPGGLLNRPLQDLKPCCLPADKTILPLSLQELCDLYHSVMFQGTAIICGKTGTRKESLQRGPNAPETGHIQAPIHRRQTYKHNSDYLGSVDRLRKTIFNSLRQCSPSAMNSQSTSCEK